MGWLFFVAELLKKKIGSAFPSTKIETMDICGRNVAEGIPKSVTINSNDILESLQEPLVGMVGAIKAALESAHLSYPPISQSRV